MRMRELSAQTECNLLIGYDRQALQPIKLEDFDEILEEEDAFFLYLQNFDTSVTDLVCDQFCLEKCR